MQESLENYLETILMLSRAKSRVRSIDIVNELDYTRASVSIAMKKLRTSGFIEVDPEGYITLTAEGRKIADSMLERHTIISDWLIGLGVGEAAAKEDACRIEHVISEETFAAIRREAGAICKF